MIHYLEDFQPGQKFDSGRLSVDPARIKSFAAEFDPQPFHLDEASARDTFFKGLAAVQTFVGKLMVPRRP